MIKIIIWLILLITFLILSINEITQPDFNYSSLPIIIGGFIGIFSTFIIQLYQNNLTCFFYWIRFKNWLRNYQTTWKVNARYDGNFDEDVVNKIENFINDIRKSGKSVKIFHKTLNSINFTIYDSLNFYIDYQCQNDLNPNFSTIDISLSSFDIGCNDSKEKLNTIIIPIFSQLQDILKPNNYSYVINLSFKSNNPFYSIYLAHLNTSQINTFVIDLHLDKYSEGKSKDLVTIRKNNIIVSANDLHSLKELSNDFIYLSSNVKKYLKVKQNGEIV